MMRDYPPKPSFDDTLDIDTAREHVRQAGDLTQDEDPTRGVANVLRYKLPLIVSRLERYPNYKLCEKYGLEPPTRETITPDSNAVLEFDEYDSGVRKDIQTVHRASMGVRELMDGHADEIQQRERERLYEQPARKLIGVLEDEYIDRPITRQVVEPVSDDHTISDQSYDDEPPEPEFGTRTKRVTAGHARLHVVGVELDRRVYHTTERQAVEAYYDRCERVMDEEMVAEDFQSYITDPPSHVRRYPEESRIPAYGEPVDWDTMADEMFIASVSDLTDSEREELSEAVHKKWPEEALT